MKLTSGVFRICLLLIASVLGPSVSLASAQQVADTPSPKPAPAPPPAPPPSYPHYASGLTHGIPDFCSTPTIKSVANGNWSNASTWTPARVPAPGDRVSVLHAVTYDFVSGPQSTLTSPVPGVVLTTGPLSCVAVKGVLRFNTSVNTRMWVGTLMVYENGELEIGTPTSPVAAGVTAEVVIADQPLDTQKDPEQFGTGLIGLGKVTISGSPRTPYVRLNTEVLAGSTLLSTASPVSGWQAGDKLVLPDSRQLLTGPSGYQPQWEELTALLPAGTAVALSTPVKYFHEGARDGNGVLNFYPHLGNLTRNVIVRSANPAGIRGHMLFATRSQVDIRYARLKDLGRTAATALDNTTFDSSGNVTKVGVNQIGRYPLHMHHVMGSIVPSVDGYQFRLVGNAVEGSKKWGITIHNSHYGWIQGNVVYGVDGGGIVTEDGSESYNLFERNFVVRVTGGGGRGDERGMKDLGWEGTGFWLRGTNNSLRDNVAADVLQDFGYKLFPYFVGDVKIPNFPGADPLVSSDFTTVKGNAIPVREFSRNEAYGAMRGGMTYWWLGVVGVTPVANPKPSLIKDLRVWHTWNWGVLHYNATLVTFDGLIVRGKTKTQTATAGWAGLDYVARNIMIKNADIQGMTWGVIPSTSNGGGIQQVQDSYLRNSVNVLMNSMWTSAAEARSILPRTVVLRNVRFDVPASSPIAPLAIQMNYSTGPVRNLVQKDDLFVYAFNGVGTDNFKVFYKEQAPTFVVPKTVISAYNTDYLEGAPVAGKTNQQTLGAYGLSIAGSIAPCTTTRASIDGLVCK